MGQSVSGLDRAPGAGLTKKDAARLKRRFFKLSQGSEQLSVSQFQLLPELSGSPVLWRLFEVFDADKDGRISLPELNQAVDYFLRLNTPHDKLKFVFKLYDVSDTGYVTEDDLHYVLANTTGHDLTPDQLRTIARNSVLEFDKDGDHRLSFQEFKAFISFDDNGSGTSTGSLAASRDSWSHQLPRPHVKAHLSERSVT